jgi:BCD family chlorophyll transporter-like MFS transporter
LALGGVIRDVLSDLGAQQLPGSTLASPAASYNAVYLIEIALLVATIVIMAPLVRPSRVAVPA